MTIFLQNLKLFIKAQILSWQLLTKTPNTILATIYKKPKYYFGNFLQKPNIILATIYKSPILFWQLFTKDLILLWQHFIKTPKLLGKQLFYQSPDIIWQKNYIMLKTQNYSLEKSYFDILNSLTHRKHKITYDILPIFQNNLFYKIHGNYAYFFHKKL